MFKIGEFSKLTQVSVRMLRYYDETGLLKPAQINRFTGYRLYTAAQIPTLNKIKFLRDLGFHVTEIEAALQSWDEARISELLEARRREIGRAIRLEQEKLCKIDLALQKIGQNQMTVHYNIFIKSIPAYPVLSLRRIVPDYYAEGALWQEIQAFAAKRHIPLPGRTFTIYHDLDYREEEIDMEVCAEAPAGGRDTGGFRFRRTEPVPEMAYTMVYGPFENIAGVYLSFANWIEEQDRFQIAGPTRQIVHRGPWNEENPAQFLTEIQIPLACIQKKEDTPP